MSQIGESPTCELQSIYLQKSSDNLADQKYICFCQLFVHSSTVGAVVKEKKQQLQSAPGWHQQQTAEQQTAPAAAEQSTDTSPDRNHRLRSLNQSSTHCLPTFLYCPTSFTQGEKRGRGSLCKSTNYLFVYHFHRASGVVSFSYIPSDTSPPPSGKMLQQG